MIVPIEKPSARRRDRRHPEGDADLGCARNWANLALGKRAGPSGAVAVIQKPAHVPQMMCAMPNVKGVRTKQNASNVTNAYNPIDTIVIRSG